MSYQLGDSISDTGNVVRLFSIAPSSRRPYGETFPGYPTGRWSDGRLIIDYIAMALGLPLLNPYLAKNASFDNGVNFAAAGSTALKSSFFLAKGILPQPVPSLGVQLKWFRKYLKSICSTPTDCANKLSRSLVFVGEFGYNDIGHAIGQGRSIQQIQDYIPLVTQTIINATREVIEAGASQVIVPGNFPLGCFPFFLFYAASNDPTAYDDLGCLKSVNNLTTFQNDGLQQALNSLRTEFPNNTILYADYYNAFRSLLRDAPTLGFDTTNLLKACCGIEGQYNPLDLGFCGNLLGGQACPNPNVYIHWDGIHLTQEAYRRMSQTLISNLGLNCTQ
ncbi:hypothetical protein DH2020_019691 [Rehmannia glutinosa]|uniref:GDSL esterase/lipase n=1 Tax=Rehmannia glutinosa TaxID=99300 RepID=A0ABR0WEG3_REHGL